MKSSPCILLAQTDSATRRSYRKVLESEGYRVAELNGDADLLELSASEDFYAIIIEENLLGTNRLDTLQGLRGPHSEWKTAIILEIEKSDSVHINDIFDVGADDYIISPVQPVELLLRIESAVHRRSTLRNSDRGHGLLGEHSRTLVLLLDFSAALAQAQLLDDLLDSLLEAVSALIPAQRVAILLPDPKQKMLTVARAVGMPDRIMSALEVPIGRGVTGRVFKSQRRALFHESVPADPDAEVYDSFLFTKAPALAMPMQAMEDTVGVLYVGDNLARERFTDSQLDFLCLISNCAASGIQSILTREAREEARDAIVVSLAKLAEHRDGDTGKHLERMTGFCVILAEQLALSSRYENLIDDTFIDEFRRAAPLHDIGKVAIPDHILLKPGRLTPDEMEIMRTHVSRGADTIRAARHRAPHSSFLMMAEEIAEAHHEWYDGGGYPRGLQGTEIPLSARIAALADVYDALTSRRVYKEAMSHAEALYIIEGLVGRQFDPVIADAFVRSDEKIQQLASKLRDHSDHEPQTSVDSAIDG